MLFVYNLTHTVLVSTRETQSSPSDHSATKIPFPENISFERDDIFYDTDLGTSGQTFVSLSLPFHSFCKLVANNPLQYHVSPDKNTKHNIR